jgi:polysaccharide export outer membrane protein
MLALALRWIAVTIFAASSAFAQSSARSDSYVIAPGDRLSISVLEDPALNQTVLVRPDGFISLPLAGSVRAAGETPESLQAQLRRSFSRDFVEPPTVTVSLVALGDVIDETPRVYVLGQVAQPGVLLLERPLDLLQALALAGGPGVFAAKSRIQLRRRGIEGDQVILFNYDNIERGATPVGAPLLLDGDVIVVPERGLFE